MDLKTLRKLLNKEVTKIKKDELKALNQALLIPGMKSHINRKKAAWKNKHPSKDTLYTWTRHKLAQSLYSHIMKLPLSQLLYLHNSLESTTRV